MRELNNKAQEALSAIMARFESGDIPEAIALATFPSFDVPSSKWSLLNRLIMLLVGNTADARGYRQWQAVGRHVVRGRRSFSIVAPLTRKVPAKDEDGEERDKMLVVGFKGQPVFRIEDTDGQPLAYEAIDLPQLPLQEVADKWGIKVTSMPGGRGMYGSYNPRADHIRLASPEEVVFLHELAHAAHHRIRPLKNGQRWDQEIVAELSAAVLCRLVSLRPANLGESWRYIESTAREAKKDPLAACAEVVAEVEKVLALICETARSE